MTTEIEQAISRFRTRNGGPDGSATAQRISAAAFRAAVQERLRGLEQDVGELKARVNGLIFVVLGAVVTQVLLKVISVD